MGYVFISYSTKDQQSADAFKKLLNDNNIKTWMAPYDIPPGSEYASVISNALKECSCLVFLFTNSSQDSRWVRKELERAINYNKVIIPLKLEEVEMNSVIEFYLADFQVVPVKKIDVSSPEIRRILKTINDFVGNASASDDALRYEAATTPVAVANKKAQKKKKSFSKKTKKTIISIIVALLIIAIGATFGALAKINGWFNKIPDNTYHITLTASEDISVADYKNNMQVIEQRAEYFSGDEKYYVEQNQQDSKVDLYLPISKFNNEMPDNVAQTYFADKIEYYVCDSNYKNGVKIDKDDITSIKVQNGTIKGVNAKDLDISTKTYDYFVIEFTDEFVKKCTKKIGSTDDLMFYERDVTGGSFWFSQIYTSGKSNVFYSFCCDNYKTKLSQKMFLNNIKNEPLTKSFDYQVDANYLATWQDTSKAKNTGKNQCNYADLEKDKTVTVTFKTNDLLSSGQKTDIETVLKKRFDILGTPYAFGNYRYKSSDKEDTVSNADYFMVKISPKKISTAVLNLIATYSDYSGLEINSGGISQSLSIGEFGYVPKKVDNKKSYSIAFKVNDESYFSSDADFTKSTQDMVYLVPSNVLYDGAKYPLLATSIKNASDIKNGITFDKVCQVVDGEYTYTNLDSSTSYIYDIINSISNETTECESYSFTDIQYNYTKSGEKTTAKDLGLQYTANSDSVTDTITEICPNAKVEYDNSENGPVIIAHLGLNQDEYLVKDSLAACEQVYKAIDFENSPYYQITMYFCSENDEESSTAFIKIYKEYQDGKLTVCTSFDNGRLENYKKDYQKQFNKNKFAKQFYLSDY